MNFVFLIASVAALAVGENLSEWRQHRKTDVSLVLDDNNKHGDGDRMLLLPEEAFRLRHNITETEMLPDAEVLQALPEDGREIEEGVGRQIVFLERRRRKREAHIHYCEKTLQLEAFNRKMSLCLRERRFSEDDAFREYYDEMNVTVYGRGAQKTSTPLNSLHLTYVVGHVEGERYSAVDGFVMRRNGRFYGSIYIDDGIIFVDPSKTILDGQTFTRYNDDGDDQDRSSYKKILRPALSKLIAKYKMSLPTISRRVKRSAAAFDRRTCDVAIVIDHLLYRNVGGSDVADTLLQVFWIIKESNAVFQSKDFDDDGVSEQLGISLAAVTILSDANSDINILDAASYPTPEDFLKEFSRYNFSNYCLGILFTNRVFDDLVLGLSWRGNPIPGGVGGICQTLAKYKADGKGRCKAGKGIHTAFIFENRSPLKYSLQK